MDRTTKIVFSIVIGLLLLFLFIGGCTILFFYKLANATKDTTSFLEECSLTKEFNTSNPQSTQDINNMIEWCCTHFDPKRDICMLLEQNKKQTK